MSAPLNIAIAGLGTVGAGTLRLVNEHAELLERRCGHAIRVVAVSARDRTRERGVSLEGVAWFDDAVEMAKTAPADVVVELIGGADGIAKQVCEVALGAGRHVVTANKALLAHHGESLVRTAEKAGLVLGFEAAVAGGIPIIKALREGLAGNRIESVYGILNGTCNYILTTMRETGRAFADVLAEAQQRGYAEADPTFDVDGIDAAHKLAILTSVTFGCQMRFDDIHIEGIRHISPHDIQFAEELGYRIKLLGIARRRESGIEQRVYPCMVPLSAPIAHVEDVYNAIVAEGDFVGSTTHVGPGAGAGPTASAVVADMVDIARGTRVPAFSVPVAQLEDIPPSPIERHRGAYYIRLVVVDRPGVIADISAALRDEQVSLEAVLQRSRAPHEGVPLVLTTHDDTEEAAMMRVLKRVSDLDAVLEPPRMIRMETL